MGRILIFIVLLTTLTYTTAISPLLRIQTTVEDSTEVQEDSRPFITFISRLLVDKIAEGLSALARLLNLKLMIVRFLTSLYTNQNLVLLRSLIEYGNHFGEVALRYLPRSVEDPSFIWITALTEFLNVNSGPGGIFYALLQPSSTTTSSSEDLSGSFSEDEAFITDAPPFSSSSASVIYQVPLSASQENPEVVSLDNLINARRRRVA